MSSLVSKFSKNIFVSDSPWQFRILLVLVILFFGGGLAIDYLASTVSFQGFSGAPDNLELDKLKAEFIKNKHSSLFSSASLLYDFAKIGLGALIASVTQNLKVDIKPENLVKDS